MKEHGLLFTAPMVRALLAGTKTQTRRLVKEPKCAKVHGRSSLPHDSFFVDDGFTGGKEPYLHWKYTGGDHGNDVLHSRVYAPHGPVGRRLWVRETWSAPGAFAMLKTGRVTYRADVADGKNPFGHPWKPAIHMPRWASRITLEVTRVRLERVQAITEEDARAEGCCSRTYRDGRGFEPATIEYRRLWDEINGASSWASNPWVWAYSFRRVE